jgi:hypothetical protein
VSVLVIDETLYVKLSAVSTNKYIDTYKIRPEYTGTQRIADTAILLCLSKPQNDFRVKQVYRSENETEIFKLTTRSLTCNSYQRPHKKGI